MSSELAVAVIDAGRQWPVWLGAGALLVLLWTLVWVSVAAVFHDPGNSKHRAAAARDAILHKQHQSPWGSA
ncbi:hypothetical protein [Mycolicibacterium fortuitum]